MAQLNDLLVMGQSTLLGPVTIDSIIDKNGSNGITSSTDGDKVLKSDDNGKVYWGIDNNQLYTPGNGLNLSNGQFSIKTGFNDTTVGTRNYGVQTDPEGRLFVNVPWKDTNTDTWRTIQCNGTSIDNNTLNLKPGSNITLDANRGNITINAVDTDTVTTCGNTVSSSKLYLVGCSTYTDYTDKTLSNHGYGVSSTYANVYMQQGRLTAVLFNASSDIRLKENLTPFTPQKSILDLPIYKYDFITGAKNQIGCMAQDLQKICPEIVDKDENGYLSIQESKIVYLLIDEIKKLKSEVEVLKYGN